MLSSLTWVPRGAGITKLPSGVQDGQNDSMDLSDGGERNGQVSDEDRDSHDSETSNQVQDGSEIDIDEVLANDLDSLAFHKRGEKDPYLSAGGDALFDEEELEDLNVRPTDSLIVAVKSGDQDVPTMEVFVFDDDPDASDDDESSAEDKNNAYIPHTYVHHDVVLPALPLCTAYTRLTYNDEPLNLVAVGMFTPGIDIWDVDRVNNLEPVISLGGYATLPVRHKPGKTRRRRKPEPRLREGSHSDAVMALSWNNVQTEYLASGSADSTVKIWDVESAHCAHTMTHHSDKVQGIAFHPTEAQLIATGAFDKSVYLADVRDKGSPGTSWNVNADVETVQWGSNVTEGMIFVSTEDGVVSVFDPRKGGMSQCAASWRGHDGPTTACAISSDIAGLMVTAGVDKYIRVWDLRLLATGEPAKLVYERKSSTGALFALSLNGLSDKDSNASPFVVAFGGAKGVLSVIDLAVESEKVRDCFLAECSDSSAETIRKRAGRQAMWQKGQSGGSPKHMEPTYDAGEDGVEVDDEVESSNGDDSN